RVGIEEVLHHDHRVVPLLDRLAVEVGGELRQVLGGVVHRDRDVLLRRSEFVPDLTVQGICEGRHDATLACAALASAPWRAYRTISRAGASRVLQTGHATSCRRSSTSRTS